MTVANKKATTSFLDEFLKKFFLIMKLKYGFYKKAQNNIIYTSS